MKIAEECGKKWNMARLEVGSAGIRQVEIRSNAEVKSGGVKSMKVTCLKMKSGEEIKSGKVMGEKLNTGEVKSGEMKK